ncbi:MAG: xanthine phosphoribosyltransferase [Myxococcales bacterium]|nr:xanthine phosphoribosyltransferase [Myxococcales bacterium]MCB9737272.1 xanthine phosphoribosyltransferase [Deltaproteobacteria bacterium]
MDELRERIRRDGRDLGRGILKVDGFINHQVDPALMMSVGEELARRFRPLAPTKVLTAEVSGVAPAFTTALALGVPLVYARKTRPVTMPMAVFVTRAPSHTKGGVTELMVSPEYLGPEDRVVIIDDFLATGSTIGALASLVSIARATLVGVGAAIEKGFERGRQEASALGVPIEAVVTIASMEGGDFVFA